MDRNSEIRRLSQAADKAKNDGDKTQHKRLLANLKTLKSQRRKARKTAESYIKRLEKFKKKHPEHRMNGLFGIAKAQLAKEQSPIATVEEGCFPMTRIPSGPFSVVASPIWPSHASSTSSTLPLQAASSRAKVTQASARGSWAAKAEAKIKELEAKREQTGFDGFQATGSVERKAVERIEKIEEDAKKRIESINNKTEVAIASLDVRLRAWRKRASLNP
ncbi:uncharacterized protein KY384_001645 [Bacidia gigantensis]|uniref:uncharacterized protein n=1 Tax=Bacidia gigantensis TaxID=2732470 RepID=UPI001D05000C|nr:uncharacterized protein KY384_001645 [Bacidia gigantensis]KAG8533904.1 hypothetical protein KY384_001645 [Bacidia gigantensis]